MQHPLYNKVFPIFDIFRFEQNKTKPNRNEGMEPRQHMVDDMKKKEEVVSGAVVVMEEVRGRTGQQTGASARSHIPQDACRQMVLLGVCVCVRGQEKIFSTK